ncbi:TNF receptor-associated factor 6-like [Ornithodoros turicata]|uniref:TNF receptor-associated factor 6-like n=1 Tax=Ornithodoros turicata TaxID=34597 RepID=UPI00313968EE
MMTSERQLVGFSEAMDWRFMNFVDLISLSVCALCSVVPKVTFVLECSHALCELCYENVLQGKRQCPLDGQDFEDVNTGKLILTPGQIGKQKARCCNVREGCDFVGTVEEVKQHFFSRCTFHAVTCSRCQVKVPRKEIVNHYVQQCESRECPVVCSPTDVMDAALEMGRKIDASLGTVIDRLSAMEDQLHVHATTIGTAKDSVVSNGDILKHFVERQERVANHDSFESVNDKLHVMMKHIDDLTKFFSLIKGASSDLISENVVTPAEESDTVSDNDHTGEAIQNSPTQAAPGVSDDEITVKKVFKVAVAIFKQVCSHHEMLAELHKVNRLKNSVAYFHIDEFAAIAKESVDTKVTRLSGIFVLFGYSCKLVVETGTRRGDLCLGVFLCMCQSSNDCLLKWPFTFPYTVMLVHPTDETKNIEFHVDGPKLIDKYSDSDNFRKPIGAHNGGFGTRALCKLQDVTNGGFVHNDSITVGVRIP